MRSTQHSTQAGTTSLGWFLAGFFSFCLFGFLVLFCVWKGDRKRGEEEAEGAIFGRKIGWNVRPWSLDPF